MDPTSKAKEQYAENPLESLKPIIHQLEQAPKCINGLLLHHNLQEFGRSHNI